MMKILAIVLHLSIANHAKVATHKADVRASERIIVKSSNGEQSRARQVRNMWRDDYKRSR